MRIPTSAVLQSLLATAPQEQVSLGWVVERLGERSFGLLLMLLALIALVPGFSTAMGLLLVLPSAQMILALPSPVLPRFAAARRLPTRRLAQLIGRLVPLLRRTEKLIKPRWATPFKATKRVVGAVILLLGVTIVSPIPFSHIIPALAIMLMALAYLEEDGVVLCIALAVALASLAMSAAAAWGAFAGIELLSHL